MFLRFFLTFVTAITLSLHTAAGWCAEASAEAVQSSKKVVLQLKWRHQFQFAGYYAAQKQGYYAAEGLEVEFREPDPDKQPLQSVLDGDAQYGVNDSSIVRARLQGKPLVIVAPIFQRSALAILTLASSSITRPEQLRGRTIMYTLSEYEGSLTGMLRRAGINYGNHTHIAHSMNDDELLRGKIDAMSGYVTDQPYYLQQKGVAVNVLSPDAEGIDFYGDTLFVKESYLDEHAHEVEAFRRASIRGWVYALSNREEMVDWIVDHYNPGKTRSHLLYEAEQIEKLIRPDLVNIGYFSRERVERIAQTYLDLDMVPDTNGLKGIYYLEHMNSSRGIYTRWAVGTLLVILLITGIAVGLWAINRRLKREVILRTRELQLQTRALRQSEQRLIAAQFIAHLGNWEWDIESDQLWLSAQARQLLGISNREKVLALAHFESAIHANDRTHFDVVLHASLAGKRPFDLEVRVADDGREAYLEIKGEVTCNERGEPLQMQGVCMDITERFLQEKRLALAASVFSHTQEGIIITDAEGRIIETNEAFEQITGYSGEDVEGKNPRLLKSDRHDDGFYRRLWQDLTQLGRWSGELWNSSKSGELFAVNLAISAVADNRGRQTHYVGVFSDITEKKVYQEELEHNAFYDILTSLPNRLLLAEKLEEAMKFCARTGEYLAVFYLDLDGFKAVNDHHGHRVGDELLTIVSSRLNELIRETDTLARVGGDEFVAVVLGLEPGKELEMLIERLLRAASTTVKLSVGKINISASIGVAISHQTGEDTAEKLLSVADEAMYIAKAAGKNRHHVIEI